jgi:hypothetical protein
MAKQMFLYNDHKRKQSNFLGEQHIPLEALEMTADFWGWRKL